MKTHSRTWQRLLASGFTAIMLIVAFVAQTAFAHGGGGSPGPGPGPNPNPPPSMHGWQLQATIDSKACHCTALYDELGKRNDWLEITVLDSNSWQCKMGGCNPPPENWLRHPGPDNDPCTQATLRKYFSNVDEADKWVNDQRKAYENGNVITPKTTASPKGALQTVAGNAKAAVKKAGLGLKALFGKLKGALSH